MPAAESRYCVAQVTDQSRDGWRDFCEAHAVNRNALAEVIGYWMADHFLDDLPELVTLWVLQARDLRAQRNRRG